MYMSTFTLSDSQWSKIVSFLKTCPDIYTGQQTDLKQFINAVLWITRSGSQWRLLPKQYGNWNRHFSHRRLNASNRMRQKMELVRHWSGKHKQLWSQELTSITLMWTHHGDSTIFLATHRHALGVLNKQHDGLTKNDHFTSNDCHR